MGIPEVDQKALKEGTLDTHVADEVVLEALPEVDWSPQEERKAKWK
jgi:hypothetical protein